MNTHNRSLRRGQVPRAGGPPTFDRRTFFRGAIVVGMGTSAAVALPSLAACSKDDVGSGARVQPTPKGYNGPARALPIPPAEHGRYDAASRTRAFHLTAQDGHSEILPGAKDTRTWGFNGAFLGPTLVASRGDRIKMEVENKLIEMTTVHWHGMKLPAYSDGGPHSPIQPGETWRPTWTVDQPAATLWYHPHPHMATALHAYRGLAGMFIVEDDVATGLDLPREYGVDDIPVVVMDAKFTNDNQLDHEVDPTLGLLGTTPLVNGITNAFFQATTRRVRLRLLNGASMRFYTFKLDNGAPLQIVATDSGLLDAPVSADELLIGPGERVEVVIDLEPDKEIKLQSVPREDNFGIPAPEPGSKADPVDFGFRDHFDILTLRGPQASAAYLPALPNTLDPAAAETAVPSAAGRTDREFVLNTFMINGQEMDMGRVDVTIDHDAPEVWHVSNENADWPHNFHIHNARFRVIDFDGAGIDVPTLGWRDVVSLPPKAKASLLVEFGHYPDATIPYMFHCHMLLHEDSGMMGQYVVVKPGEKADVRVNPASMQFDTGRGRTGNSGHSGHGAGAQGGTIDASRSPYASATDEAGAADDGASESSASVTTVPKGNPGGHQSNLDAPR